MDPFSVDAMRNEELVADEKLYPRGHRAIGSASLNRGSFRRKGCFTLRFMTKSRDRSMTPRHRDEPNAAHTGKADNRASKT